MISHSAIKKFLLVMLTSFVVFTTIISQVAVAECESLLDPDFPSVECSFDDLGVDEQMVKFGHVDEVTSESGSPTSVRFGSAFYTISNSAEINVVFDDDDCLLRVNESGFTLQFINDNFSPIDNVAFVPSSTNPREIERIWVFRCSSVQFQDR